MRVTVCFVWGKEEEWDVDPETGAQVLGTFRSYVAGNGPNGIRLTRKVSGEVDAADITLAFAAVAYMCEAVAKNNTATVSNRLGLNRR